MCVAPIHRHEPDAVSAWLDLHLFTATSCCQGLFACAQVGIQVFPTARGSLEGEMETVPGLL